MRVKKDTEGQAQVCGWFRDNPADIHRLEAIGQVVPKTERRRTGWGAQACAAAKRLPWLDFLTLSTAWAGLYYDHYL